MAIVRKTTLETIPRDVPSAAALPKLGLRERETTTVPSQMPPMDASIETSFRTGPIGAFCPRIIRVRNSMKAATSPGTGPKMKNARSIAISPKSNWRYGMSGKSRPSACESVVRTTAKAPNTAMPPRDTLSSLPNLPFCTCHPRPLTLIRIW